jgi:Spy/CpxP family protein refolding chaperone
MWRKVIAVAALSSLALIVAAVQADDDMMGRGMMGYGMGPGMMGGSMGMGGGMMSGGPYHMLNLSDDQRTKINKIQDEERRKHWETMGKIMDERARLRDLYDADKRDTQAILKVQDQINLYQRRMLELHLNTQNQIEALLTKEQREQLKSFHRGGMGMGSGYGPHGMMR